MVEPTGGMSLPTGEAVLVTPSGKIVGSADIPRDTRSAGGGFSKSAVDQRARVAEEAARTASRQRAAQEEAIKKEQQAMAIQEQKAKQQELQTAKKIEQQKQAEAAERFRIRLSAQERQMKTSQVIKRRFKEVGTGVAKAGIGIAESSVNLFAALGTRKLPGPGQEPVNSKFEFKGKLGEIRESPATTGTVLGQAATIIPLAGAGIAGFAAQVKAVGVGAATRGTLTSISPFKIRSGSFGTLESAKQIEKLKFDVLAVKKRAGDVTVKKIAGIARGDPSVQVTSTQVSKGFGKEEVGKAVTDIVAPRTEIINGKIIQGARAIRTETTFRGVTGKPTFRSGDVGVALKDLRGAGAAAQTRVVSDIILRPTGLEAVIGPGKITPLPVGAVTKPGKQFSKFYSGEAQTGTKITKEAITKAVRVKDIAVRGVEISAAKLREGFRPKFDSIKIKPGAKQVAVTKTATAPAIIAKPTQIAPATVPKPTAPTALAVPEVKVSTETVGITGQVVKTQPKQQIQQVVPSVSQVQERKVEVISKTESIVKPKQQIDQRVTPVPKQISITVPKVSPRQRTTPLSAPKTAVPTAPTAKQIVSTIPTPPTLPIIPKPKPKPVEAPYNPRLKFQPTKIPTRKPGRFGVEVRRYGEFSPIGTTKTLRGAFELGRQRVGQTLAATFRIRGKGLRLKTPTGFRRKVTPTGTLFIEKKEKRLSKVGEIKEITIAKKKKKKRRSKK